MPWEAISVAANLVKTVSTLNKDILTYTMMGTMIIHKSIEVLSVKYCVETRLNAGYSYY